MISASPQVQYCNESRGTNSGGKGEVEESIVRNSKRHWRQWTALAASLPSGPSNTLLPQHCIKLLGSAQVASQHECYKQCGDRGEMRALLTPCSDTSAWIFMQWVQSVWHESSQCCVSEMHSLKGSPQNACERELWKHSEFTSKNERNLVSEQSWCHDLSFWMWLSQVIRQDSRER